MLIWGNLTRENMGGGGRQYEYGWMKELGIVNQSTSLPSFTCTLHMTSPRQVPNNNSLKLLEIEGIYKG